jgi:predicted Zn finger-like uncharacterized protein
MDVQCERCKTEYEFDDALVSGRGTTVRCTNCGHQFKVRRPQADQANDRWIVRTLSGQQLTFLTLRELQRAILAKQVSRRDMLVRGGAPARALESIAELDPFFEGRTSSRPPPADPSNEVPTAPVTFPKRAPRWEGDAQPTARQSQVHTGSEAAPEGRPKMDTLRPPVTAGAAPPPAPAIQPQLAVPFTPYPSIEMAPVSEDAATVRRSYATSPFALAPSQASASAPEVMPPLPPPTQPVRHSMPSEENDAPHLRGSFPSSGDEHYGVPPRRHVGGWVVALALLLAVGVVGWAVAKPYLIARAAGAGGTSAQIDPRALSFLAAGEKAMVAGDLEASQEDFDKASALAEREPRVLLDEARVAAAKADIPWLKVRLLPADAGDEMRATKAQLEERVARARRAADEALSVAPDDAAAVRAKIDALRLAGGQDAARAFVGKVIAQASQPETAYVLAALDLAEPEPLWTTVIERLRLAAAGEGNAGRARAALVYALAKSGDVLAAKAELVRIDALTRPHPLMPNLHALVDKALSRPALDAGAAAAAVARAEPAATGQGGTQGAASPATGGGESVPSESRGGMQAAGAALKKGDFGRARQIYEAIVSRSPSDSEALAGLGDVARLQGDSAGAVAAYKRAIAVNPSYLPALLGLADTEWANGSRATAAHAYGDIVDRFPEGSYPSYVKQRTEGAAPAKAPQPAATGKTPSSAASPDEL